MTAMALTPTSANHASSFDLDADKFDQKRMWHRFSRWLGREDHSPCPTDGRQDADAHRPSFSRRWSRKVVTGFPRVAAASRQSSGNNKRHSSIDSPYPDRRTLSVDRKQLRVTRTASPCPVSVPKLSAPAVYSTDNTTETHTNLDSSGASGPHQQDASLPAAQRTLSNEQQIQRPAPPPSPPPDLPLDHPQDEDALPDEPMDDEIRKELDERWILNLSMHFRDRSPRERFFVTYAETPTRWRRITITIDYRDAPPDSLERDLQSMNYQRDKSARIYEAIRSSLPHIQFYDTVTNLRLQTSDDERLHVHVTEDANEVIPYPSVNLVNHIGLRRVPERHVHFDSHMSGFVYKVRVDGRTYIKKEIPGHDSVEEFLYEINALYSLLGSQNVIQFEGLVVDDEEGLVKGLLIGYAEQGPLVDLIYDYKGQLSWERRQKWAKQIVCGLSEIHEAGFVQGDFTLSNIVIDEHDTVKIIDINRRGCPVGWEPPEIATMIESGQRISMYIGIKSDLFQLGMVLWALAEEEDEPERQERPLSLRDTRQAIPEYFREVTAICLEEQPSKRISAKDLLQRFPEIGATALEAAPLRSMYHHNSNERPLSFSTPPQTEYIDPMQDVRREDIDLLSNPDQRRRGRSRSPDSHTYIERPSSVDMPFDNQGSYIVSRRGRSPPRNTASSPFDGHSSSYARGGDHQPSNAIDRNADHLYDSDSDADILSRKTTGTNYEPQLIPISPVNTQDQDPLSSPSSRHRSSHAHKWEQIEMDGRSFLVGLEDETPEERRQRLARSTFRQQMNALRRPGRIGSAGPMAEMMPRSVEHVDSGLADMDDVVVGTAEMDLVGVGGNEALKLKGLGDGEDEYGRRGRGMQRGRRYPEGMAAGHMDLDDDGDPLHAGEDNDTERRPEPGFPEGECEVRLSTRSAPLEASDAPTAEVSGVSEVAALPSPAKSVTPATAEEETYDDGATGSKRKRSVEEVTPSRISV